MEYIETLNKISLGTLVMWVLALLFLGGLIMKALEKYHKFKNKEEENDELMSKHTQGIADLNKDISYIKEILDTVVTSLEDIKENSDQREARRLRREILKFSDGLRNDKIYSRDAFQDIMESNEEYDRIIEKHDIKNGFTEQEMTFITNKYQELYGG